MIDSILTEITDRGYHLAYLRQGYGTSAYAWEASITRGLTQPRTDGYRYAVGHGQGPTPTDALESALDALENDATLLEPQTCANYGQDLIPTPKSVDLSAVLTNLRKSVPNPFAKGIRL